MEPKPEKKTAMELIREATAETGVTPREIEPKPGTFLAKRGVEDPLEDDDGSGAVE